MNVQDLYKGFLLQGKTPKDAAKLAQEKTGFSVVTGRPIRSRQLKFSKGGITYGQYNSIKR